jgi:hypothetical protein
MTLRLRTLLALGVLSIGGACTTIMDSKTVSQMAPEWFAAKSKEVKGEGYPSLNDVPDTIPPPNDRVALEAKAAALKAESARLANDPAYASSTVTDEELRARAAQLRAQAEKELAPPSRTAPRSKPE